MKTISLMIVVFVLMLFSQNSYSAEAKLCLENICIGDDVDALDVDWKKAIIDFKTIRAVKALLKDKTVNELYYEYNEQIITHQENLIKLVPHVIQLQKFDNDVLDTLLSVQAICSPLSLTGEVENNSKTKMFVTFKVVADEGKRGRLRVVRLEKEFNIFPPHLRPKDKVRNVSMEKALKQDFPGLVTVRDIDARATTNEIAFANTLLGYRFYSDVNAPLTFRILDLTDIESIDMSSKKSKHCPEEEF